MGNYHLSMSSLHMDEELYIYALGEKCYCATKMTKKSSEFFLLENNSDMVLHAEK